MVMTKFENSHLLVFKIRLKHTPIAILGEHYSIVSYNDKCFIKPRLYEKPGNCIWSLYDEIC